MPEPINSSLSQVNDIKDFSIIIASWNAKVHIDRCLHSIFSSPISPSLEVIVVDNNSSDGSVDLIETKYPQVMLVKNTSNLGFGKANNIGIRLSKGKFLCLINSDVEVLPGSIEKMIAYLNNNPSIGMLGPKIVGPTGTVQRSCMGFPTLANVFYHAVCLDSLFPYSKRFGRQLMTYWKHDRISDVDIINGCFWVVRREALETVGLLDEQFFMYGEDMDWCKRFWKAGWRVTFFSEAKAIHYGGASSSNSPIRFYLEMHRANLAYWKKHHGPVSQVFYRSLLVIRHIIRIIIHSLRLVVSSKRSESIHKIKRSAVCISFLLKPIRPALVEKS